MAKKKDFITLNPVAEEMYRRVASPDQMDMIYLKTAKKNNLKLNEVDFTKSFDFNTGSTLAVAATNPLSGTDVDALMRDFNPNGFLSRDIADENYTTIREFSQAVDNMFSYVTGSQELYKVDFTTAEGERLFSSERSSTVPTSAPRKDLLQKLGFDIMIVGIEDWKDIPLTLIANNLWNPNFVNELNNQMMKLRSEDISKLLTRGRNIDGDSFYELLRGYEHILKWCSGDYTFSNERKAIFGEYGYWRSANRINVAKINATYATTWSGSDTFTLLDEMYLAMPEDYRDDENNVIVMNSTDFFKYMQYRTAAGIAMESTAIGVNTETRENAVQNGMVPRHRGIRILTNRWTKQISKGGVVVFGDMREFLVATSPEANKRNIFFNARNGGGSWEYTDIFRYGTGVRNAQKFVVAFSTYGWTADGNTESSAVVKAPAIYAVDARYTNLTNKLDLTTGIKTGDNAYLFADMTPERYKIIYGAKDATKTEAELIASGTRVDAGFDIGTLAEGTYDCIVYDTLGMLDANSVQTITVSAAS